MKPQEARDMTPEELLTRERELADELFHLRLRRATSQLPNPMKVRETRRDLARVKTVLRERALRGAAAPAAPKVDEAAAETAPKRKPARRRAPRATTTKPRTKRTTKAASRRRKK